MIQLSRYQLVRMSKSTCDIAAVAISELSVDSQLQDVKPGEAAISAGLCYSEADMKHE